MAKALDASFTLSDCKLHATDKSCWLAVNGKVYDVTDFLEEHPGGYDIILASTGKDATQDFEEIGHSNSAKQLLEKYLIGKLEGGAEPVAVKTESKVQTGGVATQQTSSALRTFHVLLPILLIIVAVALNYLSKR